MWEKDRSEGDQTSIKPPFFSVYLLSFFTRHRRSREQNRTAQHSTAQNSKYYTASKAFKTCPFIPTSQCISAAPSLLLSPSSELRLSLLQAVEVMYEIS